MENAEKLPDNICPACGSEMPLVMGGYYCDNPDCDNYDPDRIPALSADIEMDWHLRKYAELQDEIDTLEKRREAEIKSITDYFDGKIMSKRGQQDFWMAPVRQCLLARVAADPKAKKSHESPVGKIKMNKCGGGYEVDKVAFNLDDHKDKAFVKEVVSLKVVMADLKKYIEETGELPDGVSVKPEGYNFSVTITRP